MSYETAAVAHYHPCELQHLPHNSTDYGVSSNTATLYESEIPFSSSSVDQVSCETPLPLIHTTDSDSDSDSTASSSSSSSSRKSSKKHHKHRRSHHSSSSSRANSLVVPEKVRRQGDVAINDILERLQERQASFGKLSTTHYSDNGYGAHRDDDDEDDDEDEDNNDDGEEALRTVHHDGLAPELLKETLGPCALRQHHGNANLRHG
ncbi:hypothetical protein BGZ96_007625 [Linnemannia gamsii]|uniref:Uncharacterized protein n=1 Tax=Linnemannia gamsii TaxID=64522 RepID=A0ABQ7KH26_9FUNG|nr:hypothetical protein BGZ96_007625 [Linnemannia gamsii]